MAHPYVTHAYTLKKGSGIKLLTQSIQDSSCIYVQLFVCNFCEKYLTLQKDALFMVAKSYDKAEQILLLPKSLGSLRL